jgi:hypothetical protein
MMEKQRRESSLDERRTEVKRSFYTIHPPGEYTSEAPYRDYPVVEAEDGMTGQVVDHAVDVGLEVKTEKIDPLAWVVFVSD